MAPRMPYVSVTLAAALIVSGCDREQAVSHKANERSDPTPSNAYCLENPMPVSSERTPEELWELYRHYAVCDYDKVLSDRALDELVARDDPAALLFKGETVRRQNPEAGLAYMRRAADLGYQPAKDLLRELER